MGWPMLPSILASAIAARSLGYPSLADTILADELTPTQIARLFKSSAAHDKGRMCAIVLLTGSTARYNANREGWDGSLELQLAMQALGGEADFVAANREAVKLVRAHWPEITAQVQSVAPIR